MTHDEAWAGYREYIKAFADAGIPWSKKGSPHKLLIKARWFLKQLPNSELVSRTIRARMPELISNMTANNALLKRLMRK